MAALQTSCRDPKLALRPLPLRMGLIDGVKRKRGNPLGQHALRPGHVDDLGMLGLLLQQARNVPPPSHRQQRDEGKAQNVTSGQMASGDRSCVLLPANPTRRQEVRQE